MDTEADSVHALRKSLQDGRSATPEHPVIRHDLYMRVYVVHKNGARHDLPDDFPADPCEASPDCPGVPKQVGV